MPTSRGDSPTSRGQLKRRWRHFETPSGRRPALEFIRGLSDVDKAAVLAAMAEVRDRGLVAARHLEGDLYEVRADGERVIYRVFFALDGAGNEILLALVAFKKKTQKTPASEIRLADRRLKAWRSASGK
jgi:phage-related protein